ncbi:MAG TPA: hypothetical protein VEA40_26510, partial [Ramlibacter sp.]|nr:hypothetical protein [Ramlibacter sp.]
DRPARLRMVLRDGREVQAECLSARGGPDRPWEAGVIEDKVRSLVGALSPAFAEQLLALVELPDALLVRPWPQLLADVR